MLIFTVITPIIEDQQYSHREIINSRYEKQKCCWTIYSNEYPEIFHQIQDLLKTVQEKDRDAIERIINSIAQREINKHEQELIEYQMDYP